MSGAAFSAGYHVAAVNSLLWKIDVMRSVSQFTWSATEIPEVMEFFKQELSVVFPASYSGAKQFRLSSVRGAILRALISMPEQEEEISRFVRVMASGYPEEGMTASEAKMPLMLRNIAHRLTEGKGGITTSDKHRLWISSLRCIRAHLTGKPIKYESNAIRQEALVTQPFPIFLDSKPPYQTFSTFLAKSA